MAEEAANPPLGPTVAISAKVASFLHLPPFGTSSKQTDRLCKACKDHCHRMDKFFEASESTGMATMTVLLF